MAVSGFELDTEQAPIYVGAGVIKTPEDIERYVAIKELAALVIGSYSWDENGGNDPTGLKKVFDYDPVELRASNAVALRNVGHWEANKFLGDGIKRVQDLGKIAVISITSLRHEKPSEVLPALVDWAASLNPDGVEINFSCPNEKHGLLCEDFDGSMEAMDSIEQAVGRGVYTIAKMSALPAEDVRTFRQNGFGADAIDTINAIKRPMPRRNGQPALEVDVEHVGVSGPVIYKVARENLSHWSDGSGGRDYAVWSIGGVDTGYEVYHRMRSGAALVGGTQMFYRSEQPDAVAKQWAEQYKTCVVNVAQRTQR